MREICQPLFPIPSLLHRSNCGLPPPSNPPTNTHYQRHTHIPGLEVPFLTYTHTRTQWHANTLHTKTHTSPTTHDMSAIYQNQELPFHHIYYSCVCVCVFVCVYETEGVRACISIIYYDEEVALYDIYHPTSKCIHMSETSLEIP